MGPSDHFDPNTATHAQQLAFALGGLDPASWHFETSSGFFRFDENFTALVGLPAGESINLEEFLGFFQPSDRVPLGEQFLEALRVPSQTAVLRIVTVNNSTRKKIYLSGSPYYDRNDQLAGIAGVAFQIPVSAISHLMEADEFTGDLTQNNPDVITRWDKDLRLIFGNSAFANKAGRPVRELLGQTNVEMGQPEYIAIPYMQSLRDVFQSGQPKEHYNPFPTSQGPVFYQSRMTPEKDIDGNVISVLAVARDITALKAKEDLLAASESRFRDLIHQAPVATCLFVGEDMRIEVANDLMISYWGKDRSVIGMPLSVAVPELEEQPFLQILQQVYQTGQTYESQNAPAILEVNGVLSPYYFDFTYKPLFDQQGKVYGIMDMAVDVSAQALFLQELRASEQRLRSIIASAPAAMGIFLGKELMVELPNQAFIEIIGKGQHIAGQRLEDLLPELASQDFLQHLDLVYSSGEPYQSFEAPVEFLRDGRLEQRYFNLSFTPLKDAKGSVYGILDISIDVTDSVLAKQQIQLAEQTLQNVVEMAEIATWQIDLTTGKLSCSQRLLDWYGLDRSHTVSLDEIKNMFEPRDLVAFEELLFQRSDSPEKPLFYSLQYTICAADGQKRVLFDQGEIVYYPSGEALILKGSVLDVTQQTVDKAYLEDQVKLRTAQLEASLSDLERSNANLLQFAYVASHDLQEPLRKIQTFADLLKRKHAATLASGIDHLQRIEDAASRMSVLIHDLLNFSQISTHQQSTQQVPLGDLMQQVISELDLSIADASAVVKVGDLPEISGDRGQLGQLFSNLLSNAIKFRAAGKIPVIEINCQLLDGHLLPDGVLPSRKSPQYYCIRVEDNGVGFDQQYTDRIFQVFQRLHSRSEYAGTGIGLAICEKVAANHGGTITAASTLGQGTVFSVYLPV